MCSSESVVMVSRVKVVLTRARLAMRCDDANKKEKIGKEKSAVQCVQLEGCTGDVPAGVWCVRACGERACVLVQLSCNSAGEMRYAPRDTRHDRARARAPLAAPAESSPDVPSARQKRAPRATFRRSRQATFGRPLQDVAPQCLANNTIQT